MLTATRILDWLGLILLAVGLAYRVGGWRKWWGVLRQPMSARVELDPRFDWWATPMSVLGFALLVLSQWRSCSGV
jgi:hypothetical protein